MKNRITSITRVMFCNFLLLLLLSCSNIQKNDVNSFIEEYINTVSSEHTKFKCNISEKMKSYYMNYENKEMADMPEYLEIGPFRNNVLIINNYTIISIKEISQVIT